MKDIARRFSCFLTRFADERRGVAALEFAMLLPMMMSLFLGSVEISTGVSIRIFSLLTRRGTLASEPGSVTESCSVPSVYAGSSSQAAAGAPVGRPSP